MIFLITEYIIKTKNFCFSFIVNRLMDRYIDPKNIKTKPKIDFNNGIEVIEQYFYDLRVILL